MVVHNGIIENHEPLREELKARGYTFVSETDTEVIAHLVNWELKQGGTLRDHGLPSSGYPAGGTFW